MEALYAVIALLAILNVFQLWFWSRTTHRLIDKVMSRNYAEYVQTQTLANAYPKSQSESDTVETDQQLSELNGMLGLG